MAPGLQHAKLVSVTPPAAIVDNAAFTTAAVDTIGWRYCTFVVYIGALDIAPTLLKVQESNSSDMSGAADVTNTVVGTATDAYGDASALPAATDDNKFVKIRVDLRGRKRYLDLLLTGGDGVAGTFAAAFAILERGEVQPDSAADEGCLLVMSA